MKDKINKRKNIEVFYENMDSAFNSIYSQLSRFC